MTDWLDADLELRISAMSADDKEVGHVWVDLPDGVDAGNVEAAVRSVFGEPIKQAFVRHLILGEVHAGWYFPGSELARFGLPPDGNSALIIPSCVRPDQSHQPVFVAQAMAEWEAASLASRRNRLESRNSAAARVSGAPVELGGLDSRDPLEVIGHVLGDEALGGSGFVGLRPESSIDMAMASIGDSGDLIIRSITRDGMTSRFEDVWRVEAGVKREMLERLLTEQFPEGVPFDDPTPEVEDELLLRLIRARLVSVSRVTRWLDDVGIPSEATSQYHGGFS